MKITYSSLFCYLCLTMKRTALLLALYILLKPAVPVADFVFNYGYIIAELCINRDKPEVDCNGKCYLKKKLAEAAEQENPISQDRKVPMPAYELFFQDASPIISSVIAAFIKQIPRTSLTNIYPQEEIHDIFRPPIFIS